MFLILGYFRDLLGVRNLASDSYTRGSTDNITILVIKFQTRITVLVFIFQTKITVSLYIGVLVVTFQTNFTMCTILDQNHCKLLDQHLICHRQLFDQCCQYSVHTGGQTLYWNLFISSFKKLSPLLQCISSYATYLVLMVLIWTFQDIKQKINIVKGEIKLI